MMSVKAAEDPKEALQALWPRLQALAVEPARDEADFVERRAVRPSPADRCRSLSGGGFH
jgi:hypothetical protein